MTITKAFDHLGNKHKRQVTMSNRTRILVRSQIISFARDPLNVVLAVLIPFVVIQGLGMAMETFPQAATMDIDPALNGKITGALFSTGFVAGLSGLHQVLSAEQADRRLAQSGLQPGSLLVARIITVLVICAGVAGLSYGIISQSVEPAAPILAYLSLLLAGGIYALVGILIGAVSPSLFEGSLVVLIIADMDAFLGSGMAGDTSLEFLPLYYPNELFRSAVFSGTISESILVPQLVYLLVLSVLTGLVYRRSIDSGGVF